MANKNFYGRTLQIVLENGVNESGKMTFKSKNIKSIRESITPDVLYDVALKLSALQSLPLSHVMTDEDFTISAI